MYYNYKMIYCIIGCFAETENQNQNKKIINIDEMEITFLEWTRWSLIYYNNYSIFFYKVHYEIQINFVQNSNPLDIKVTF